VYKVRLIIIINLIFSFVVFAQIPYRYTDSLFTFEEPQFQIVYATAPELNRPYFGESFTHDEELIMRLFTPQDNTTNKRPAIICIHGGAFISGNQNHDDMIAFCELFASRGYVSASIKYRLGMNPLSPSSSERAVYRGLQDSRAAIRYLKENHEAFRIDTNNVYILGSSAGAFAGLHNVFMNEDSERPASTFSSPDLGDYDAIENQYKHNGQPDGLIALWGALSNTNLIQSGDEQIPVFLVHGTDDDIVPFGIDHPFGISFYPETYGSKVIAERFVELNYPHETYFVEGEGHEFYGASNGNWSSGPNEYWDTTATRSVNFLYNLHKPTASFELYAEGNTITFYDFSTQNITDWYWNFGDGNTSFEQNPVHTYTEEGEFKVLLTVKNEIDSWDTTSMRVNISITGITENNNLPNRFSLSQNYPNPFNPVTTIKFNIEHSSFTTLSVYDILGNEVTRLVNDHISPGTYLAKWNAENYPSGLYIYKLISGSHTISKKMLLLK
jgi:predicted esterase